MIADAAPISSSTEITSPTGGYIGLRRPTTSSRAPSKSVEQLTTGGSSFANILLLPRREPFGPDLKTGPFALKRGENGYLNGEASLVADG